MTIDGIPDRPDRRWLRTGRVRARLFADDEGAALAALAALEAAAGPLPWAFVLEPADGERWEVRADLPAPDAVLGVDGVVFEGADSPGLVEAVDRGWLDEEREEFDGVVVRRWTGPDGPRRPDLHRPPVTDEVLRRLEGVLAEAAAPFPLLADGLDPASVPVVHRATGAPGLEVWIGGDPLPERREVLARVASAVATQPLLVPLVEFDEAMGHLLVRCWLAAPPGPGLPGDDGVADAAWFPDRVANGADVEVQVIPATAADHDRVVDAVAAVAERAGLAGGPPRWVGGAFAATWVGELPTPEVLAELRTLPGVGRVRITPGVPYGLEPSWVVLEPAWRVVGGVTWQRLRDPVRDRDLCEVVEDREADARDHDAAANVAAMVRPILDASGRRGLEVRGARGTLLGDVLGALLADLAVDHPELSRVGTFGFARDGAVARRWYRDGVDPGGRRWDVL